LGHGIFHFSPPLHCWLRGLRDLAAAGSAHEEYLAKGIRFARTCYDHLAGRLGVLVTDALITRRALSLARTGCCPARRLTYSEAGAWM